MNRQRSVQPERLWRRATCGALVLGLIVCAAPTGAAFASERSAKAEAKAEVEKAQLHYKLGRFEDALAAYTKAYELFHAPALLFNIGQCHKNLKNYERAIFFFEGYLREERNPEKRTLAEQLIESSRADLLRQRNEPAPLAPPAPTPLSPTPPSPTPDAGAPEAGMSEPVHQPAPLPEAFPPPPPPIVDNPPPQPEPVTEKWWFWTALGVGVLAIAGGTLAYYATGSTSMVPPGGTIGTLDRR
ncbi:MAG TPA: tetratricopeptide repeat protein [Polyangia bacterium]|nr:tetratricopeptide repeat protein [Polyangia bacterium]